MQRAVHPQHWPSTVGAQTPFAPAIRRKVNGVGIRALNLHCGMLSVVIDSPPHGVTPDELVYAQLLMHLEAMKFLAETGSRYRWAPGKKK